MTLVRNQSEDGLLRRVCALLSLPWISENETSSAYSSSGFPSWVLTLAQKLSSFYCEYSQLYSNINTICLQQNKKKNYILAQNTFPSCVISAPEVQVDCVCLLALLRQGVCDTWRVCVFSKALQNPEEMVRAAAVRAAPLFLHHVGNLHYNLIRKALRYEECKLTL